MDEVRRGVWATLLSGPARFSVLLAVFMTVAFVAEQPGMGVFPDLDISVIGFLLGISDEGYMPRIIVYSFPICKHICPLYTLHIEGMLDLFGFDEAPWQLAQIVYQSLSGLILFIIVRSETRSFFPALLVGILWSAAVVGGVDDSASTRIQGMYTLALTFLFAARGFMTLFMRTGDRTHLFAGGAMVAISMLYWEGITFCLPMLALHFAIYNGPRIVPRYSVGFWSLFVCTSGLLLALFVTIHYISDEVVSRSEAIPGFFPFVIAVLKHLSDGLSLLTVSQFSNQYAPGSSIWLSVAVFVACVPLIWKDFRLLLSMLSIPLGIVMVVVLTREEYLWFQAKYIYFCALWWCVLLGLAIGNMIFFANQYFKVALITLGGVFVIFFISHSRNNARISAEIANERWAESAQGFAETKEFLSLISSKCCNENDPIVVPNVPVPFRRDAGFFFRLSALSPLIDRQFGKCIVFRDPLFVTMNDRIKLLELLKKMPRDSSQIRWTKIIENCVPDIAAIQQANLIAQQKGIFVDVPNIGIPLDDTRSDSIPLRSLIAPSQVSGLRINDNDYTMSANDWASLQSLFSKTQLVSDWKNVSNRLFAGKHP